MNIGKMIFEIDVDEKNFDKKMASLQEKAQAKQKKIEQIQQKISKAEAEMEEYRAASEAYWKQYEEIMAKQAMQGETEFKNGMGASDPYEAFGKGETFNYNEKIDELVDYDKAIEDLNKEMNSFLNKDYDKITKEITTQKEKLEGAETEYNKILQDMQRITEEYKAQQGFSLKNTLIPSDLPKAKNIVKSITKDVKKLALGIIGAAGGYRIIRKATQAYLETDEHTTKQMEANWIAIGTFMENTIKYVSTLMKKLVTSILYFASVLTGVNYIEKANAAILKKQEKATKDLTNANNKLTASFDEMEILGDTSSSANMPEIDTAVLFNINDISERTREIIEKIGNALKPVYETLKSIVDYCTSHPDVIALMLGGLGLTKLLASIIGKVGAASGVGATGLAGVLSLLGYIAGIGAITISIAVIYSTVKEAQQETQTLIDKLDKLRIAREKLNEKRKETILSGSATEEDVQRFIDQIKTENDEIHKNTLQIAYNRQQMGWWDEIIYNLSGEWASDTKQIENNYEALKENIDTWGLMYEQGLLNDRQMRDYITQLYNYQEYLEATTEETKKHTGELTYNKDKLKDAEIELEKTKDKLKQLTGSSQDNRLEMKRAQDEVQRYNNELKKVKSDIKTKFDVDTSGAKKSLNNLFSGLSAKLSAILGINFPTIKLAKGGIVNNPGRGVSLGSNVIAGEAGPEAVLPLNEETMSMLARLIADKMIINLTNVNQMNGRVISREMQRIQNEDNFAFNK